MIIINLPELVEDVLWEEWCDQGFGIDGVYPGFKHYVRHRLSAKEVSGTIVKGFTLAFEDEQDLIYFYLKWQTTSND